MINNWQIINELSNLWLGMAGWKKNCNWQIIEFFHLAKTLTHLMMANCPQNLEEIWLASSLALISDAFFSLWLLKVFHLICNRNIAQNLGLLDQALTGWLISSCRKVHDSKASLPICCFSFQNVIDLYASAFGRQD